jgi:hypothetical protein
MSYVFISHVEEDRTIALELAKILEESGISTWYYERDSVPGPSYLVQAGRAIVEAAVVAVIISPLSLASPQLTKEIVRAHEAGKSFVPILSAISHSEFQAKQPEWREAIGGSTSISLPAEGVRSIGNKILAGLRFLGLNRQHGVIDERKLKISKEIGSAVMERIIALFPDIRDRYTWAKMAD